LNLPCGIVHLVYTTGDFASEVRAAEDAGARMLLDPAEIFGGFGRRKIAFFRSPGGMIFEIIEIMENRVPEV
jgi:catechol 2,3-dioxygenase-like lactoylglutathione lyase family enzyme